MCIFFIHHIKVCAHVRMCSLIVGSNPRQNGLVAMNVALQHWATVILPLKSNSRSSIYLCASSEKINDLLNGKSFILLPN